MAPRIAEPTRYTTITYQPKNIAMAFNPPLVEGGVYVFEITGEVKGVSAETDEYPDRRFKGHEHLPHKSWLVRICHQVPPYVWTRGGTSYLTVSPCAVAFVHDIPAIDTEEHDVEKTQIQNPGSATVDDKACRTEADTEDCQKHLA